MILTFLFWERMLLIYNTGSKPFLKSFLIKSPYLKRLKVLIIIIPIEIVFSNIAWNYFLPLDTTTKAHVLL